MTDYRSRLIFELDECLAPYVISQKFKYCRSFYKLQSYVQRWTQYHFLLCGSYQVSNIDFYRSCMRQVCFTIYRHIMHLAEIGGLGRTYIDCWPKSGILIRHKIIQIFYNNRYISITTFQKLQLLHQNLHFPVLLIAVVSVRRTFSPKCWYVYNLFILQQMV